MFLSISYTVKSFPFFNIRVTDASKTFIIASESVHDYAVTKLRAQLRYFLRNLMLHLWPIEYGSPYRKIEYIAAIEVYNALKFVIIAPPVFMSTIVKSTVTFLRSIDTAGEKCPILKNTAKHAENVK